MCGEILGVGVQVFLFRHVRCGVVCRGGTAWLIVKELLIDVLLC